MSLTYKDVSLSVFDLLTFVNHDLIKASTKFQNPTIHLSYFNYTTYKDLFKLI